MLQVNKNAFFLFSILLLAFALRILGIWHDYPYSFYPDEAHFVKRSLSFGAGDFNPHWFHKPALFMYILFIEYGVFYIIGFIASLWDSVEEFAVSFVVNPGPFYIVGRVTVALFSVATVYVTYLLGRRHFNVFVGLLAALLVSLAFGHVASSQDVKADIPAGFFTILSAYFILNYTDTHQLKNLIFSIIFAGAGTATKYYPYAMMIPIVLAIFAVNAYPYSKFKQNWKNTFLLCLGSLCLFYLTFFILSPFNFIDPLGLEATFGRFIKLYETVMSLFTENSHNSIDQWRNAPMSRAEGLFHYIKTLISASGLGYIIGTASIAGFFLILFRIKTKIMIFLAFPLVFMLVSIVLSPGYVEARHQLPIYPFLAITGAYFVHQISSVTQRPIIVYLFVFILVFPLWNIIDRGLFISKTDTRNVAKQWIEKNIPAGQKIVLDEYGPVLQKSKTQLQETYEKAKNADKTGQFTAHYAKYIRLQIKAAEKTKTTYFIDELRFPWWMEKEPEDGQYDLTEYDRDKGNPLRPLGVKSLEYYKKHNYQYAILSSIRYNPFFVEDSHRYNNFPSFREFYHDVFNNAELVKQFSPQTDNRPGPTIRIYHLQ